MAGLRSQLASSAQELARAHAESDAVASKHSEALRVAQEECDRLRSERDRSALDAAAARDDTAALHASIETLRTKFADEARAMSDELNAQLSREEDLKRDARKWKVCSSSLGTLMICSTILNVSGLSSTEIS